MNTYGWCPLLSKNPEFQTKCIEGECAWWDYNCKDCIVFSIKRKLKDIEDKGDEICSKEDDIMYKINT